MTDVYIHKHIGQVSIETDKNKFKTYDYIKDNIDNVMVGNEDYYIITGRSKGRSIKIYLPKELTNVFVIE